MGIMLQIKTLHGITLHDVSLKVNNQAGIIPINHKTKVGVILRIIKRTYLLIIIQKEIKTMETTQITLIIQDENFSLKMKFNFDH